MLPKEEKYPPRIITSIWDSFNRVGQKHRIIYDPDRDNADWMKTETTRINPPGIESAFDGHARASNDAVRRLEYEKIMASPDPERALQRYNDFNSRWIYLRTTYLELFKLEREYSEYGLIQDTEMLKMPRIHWIAPYMSFVQELRVDRKLEPTYFGYSAKVHERK